jgi:hypothetical protein
MEAIVGEGKIRGAAAETAAVAEVAAEKKSMARFLRGNLKESEPEYLDAMEGLAGGGARCAAAAETAAEAAADVEGGDWLKKSIDLAFLVALVLLISMHTQN